MSQRRFKTEKYDVVTGWDRPLQYHFLVIWKIGMVDDAEEGLVFSNLDLENPAMQLGEIEKKLKELNIDPPETLLSDLFNDTCEDRGNFEIEY